MHFASVLGMSVFMIVFVVFASGCASSGAGSPEAEARQEAAPAAGAAAAGKSAAASNVQLERYTEQVPGSASTFDMVPVPAGTVTVSTAAGAKTINLPAFWISETEVKWEEFDIYAYGTDLKDAGKEAGSDGIIRPSKPYGAPDRGFGHAGYAALSMSYGVGQEYARWLSQLTGKKYRLPTEAEYQYACEAGQANDPAPLAERAVFADNAENKTQPIKSKKPNAWGIYDMLGNALEWCTPVEGNPEDQPMACGGSYLSPAAEVNCASRTLQTPEWQETDPQIPKSVFWLTDATWIGFRVVREQ